MSQVILSYKFHPKHFESQKVSINTLNKNTAIAYTNDRCSSSNYQQYGQTPALLVMECFRDSFLKPYAASSAKQPEPCFHWVWKYFIKKYYDVLSPSFQLHHTVNKILIILLKPRQDSSTISVPTMSCRVLQPMFGSILKATKFQQSTQ